jgi:hypothetical protein
MLARPRRWLGRCTVLVAALWLMGLGGGTESSSTTSIPLPPENFTVTLADRAGQTLEARRFTWEGKVIFRGLIGSGTVSLPFNKVKAVHVQGVGAGSAVTTVKANVTLRSGDTVEVLIDRSSKCFGETKFGDYEIFFKDVASIEFQ